MLDDSSLRISLFSGVCSRCLHFDVNSPLGEKKTCKAFPNGIPGEIWLGENDHTKPFPGDNGIVFEAIPLRNADAIGKEDSYEAGRKDVDRRFKK